MADARVCMIGFPSVGKSTLLSKVTKTESVVGAYEFTTLTVSLAFSSSGFVSDLRPSQVCLSTKVLESSCWICLVSCRMLRKVCLQFYD